MGWNLVRLGPDGKPRYTARYRDIRSKSQSAGTFKSERAADRAWQRKEADIAAGKLGDPRRGQQTFKRYVLTEWFPHHVIEASTRQGYHYLLHRYVLPEFGPMRMNEILPSHVRAFVLKLQDVGVNPPTIEKCKVVLDSIFTTALNDQITYLHAGKGVKTPPVARKPRKIVTAEQFDTLYAALGDPTMRLLVETDIETGLRWGELTELRPMDIDFSTDILTISRAVVVLSPKFHPEGKRFLVKQYPKDKEWRQIKLPVHLIGKLKDHIATLGLDQDDLLFELKQQGPARRSLPDELPDPETLGKTEPNDKGRVYNHGTVAAYSLGKCRCVHCKNAIAFYRAERRAAGKDSPRRPRTVDTDGHISNDWFRNNVWNKALEKSELGFRVTPHGLRHAHASWLIAGGADLQVVKARLGHGTIRTTEKYLHELPGSGDAALQAMETYRGKNATAAAESEVAGQLSITDTLRRLAALRDDGILTEAEFCAKKSDLLGRI